MLEALKVEKYNQNGDNRLNFLDEKKIVCSYFQLKKFKLPVTMYKEKKLKKSKIKKPKKKWDRSSENAKCKIR